MWEKILFFVLFKQNYWDEMFKWKLMGINIKFCNRYKCIGGGKKF